jgi:cytoskeletal protein RodZ
VAKHSPEGDKSFSLSLVRHLGAAVALVAVIAAGFWGIGQLQDGSSPEITAAPTTTPDVTATSEPVTDGAMTPATDGATTDPTPATSPADEGTAAPTDAATATDGEDDATEAADEPSEQEVASGGGDVDPAEISLQVLDATGGDPDAAAEVAATLRSDGFRVVAENKAVKTYEVTTVFYTPGNEAKAEQVAAMYGYREVAPEPGNLSHAVDVHVVVGADA